jgi:hypothetical protein
MRAVVHLFAASTLLLTVACSADEAPPRGQLMVTLATDMSVPKDVTHLRVKVKLGAEIRSDQDYALAPDGEFQLPGTLAVVEGSTPNPTVSVDVVGIRNAGGNTEARTYSRFTTTVPRERSATLHVPVQWLCDGTALSDGDGGYLSSCAPIDGEEAACVAGTCQPVAVDSSTLLDFEQSPASCFDTVACFHDGEDVPAAEIGEDCTLSLASDESDVNVALRTTSDGICSGGVEDPPCYVPLDHDDVWGFRVEGRNVVLPPAACAAVEDGRAEAIRISSACPTKLPAQATCGPWSASGSR